MFILVLYYINPRLTDCIYLSGAYVRYYREPEAAGGGNCNLESYILGKFERIRRKKISDGFPYRRITVPLYYRLSSGFLTLVRV